jgi:3-mercaptopyruvate sulfurtransferase SseA
MLKAFMMICLGIFAVAACQKADDFVKYKSDADVPRISLADAKKDFDAGDAVFIDSRNEETYKGEHIKGSINIPFGEQDKMMDKVPKGKKLIIYCS